MVMNGEPPAGPPQGPPMAQVAMMFLPVPQSIDVGHARTADGTLVVTLQVMLPRMTALLTVEADNAKALAAQIIEHATGIEIPSPGATVTELFRPPPGAGQ